MANNNNRTLIQNSQITFSFSKIGLENGLTQKFVYIKLNEKIEQMSKWVHMGVIYISFGGVAIPPILATLINYFINDMGNESYEYVELMYVEWQSKYFEKDSVQQKKTFSNANFWLNLHFLKILTQKCRILSFNFVFWRLPIDRNSFFGYMIFVIFQSIGYFCTTYTNVPTIGLYVGACWLFIDFVKDVTANVLNQIVGIGKSKKAKSQMKIHFYRMVQIYTDVKQLSVLTLLPTVNSFLLIHFISFWFLDLPVTSTLFMKLNCFVFLYGHYLLLALACWFFSLN